MTSGSSAKHILITGGAGFIGINLADRLATLGHFVTLFDNLSRVGVSDNISWLLAKHGKQITVERADVREGGRLTAALTGVDQVFHLAAQVAVTTSIMNPRYDYEVNIGGTINLLEALRAQARPPSLVFTSTNKVYGALRDLELGRVPFRYEPTDAGARKGINETRPLEFYSPYGCSKGAADQYVLDYTKTFHIPAVVFRMSCIYGPHQMGSEDQGWIAHFLIQALKRCPISVCGDGYQVRDVLYVDDLVDAMIMAQDKVDLLQGQAFNIGGGPRNTLSLLELLDFIETQQGRAPQVTMESWRLGDQRYYVSDVAKFARSTGWEPRVAVPEGLRRLSRWLEQQHDLPGRVEAGGDRAVLTH